MIAFLASTAASYVTGASWAVHGSMLQIGQKAGSAPALRRLAQRITGPPYDVPGEASLAALAHRRRERGQQVLQRQRRLDTRGSHGGRALRRAPARSRTSGDAAATVSGELTLGLLVDGLRRIGAPRSSRKGGYESDISDT